MNLKAGANLDEIMEWYPTLSSLVFAGLPQAGKGGPSALRFSYLT